MWKLLLLFLFVLSGCSSFGIRTSTAVIYTEADGGARVVVYVEGNIPGAGVNSEVPLHQPRVDINAAVNAAAAGGEATDE